MRFDARQQDTMRAVVAIGIKLLGEQLGVHAAALNAILLDRWQGKQASEWLDRWAKFLGVLLGGDHLNAQYLAPPRVVFAAFQTTRS